MPHQKPGVALSAAKARVPAVEGWFTIDGDAPHLIGSRCTTCGTRFFPRRAVACADPACRGTEFEDVALSRTGKVWSYTENRYQPPPPYVSPDPFVPYVIAAVELDEEKIVVMGQVVAGVTVDDLKVGMPMELTVDTLFEDEESRHVVWKWQPAGARASA
jgi:uncharacterized OB-fold protein